MSYPTLTELTRTPASTRNHIEKNWFLFFPTPETSFIHYDIAPRYGRAFAKLLGSGLTTPNMTDVSEHSCLSANADSKGRIGQWHQASNSLKLLLCSRADGEAQRWSENQDGRAVHFALVHRKFSNELDLPMRYERHFIVWSTRFPFTILAVSKYPSLLADESASGWTEEENDAWARGETGVTETNSDSGSRIITRNGNFFPSSNSSFTNATNRSVGNSVMSPEEAGSKDQVLRRDPRAYFSYTPSINWARRPHRSGRQQGEITMDDELLGMQTGYLDDEIVLGIGLDDARQGFARVKAESLLSCLRICDLLETHM